MTTKRLCPFLEWTDGRCASRQTLGGLRETFRLCAGDPLLCPVHREIRREQLLRNVKQRGVCCV